MRGAACGAALSARGMTLGAARSVALVAFFVFFASMTPAGAQSQDADFKAWLGKLQDEALEAGISRQTLVDALTDIEPLPRVIELDRSQPEFKLTFAEYLGRFVSPWRRDTARRLIVEHSDILDQVAEKYGVQKRFIVTMWGIETSFGKHLGSFNVPQALVTLAYDGRRSAYFRRELLNALQIIEEGHIMADEMKGSWAGAMGQSQFMPSSFLSFAEDWDGDGRRDIWETTEDVFASTANYLSKVGWRDDITWGRAVRIPDGFTLGGIGAREHAEAKTRMTLPKWGEAGITNADGSPLPTRSLHARIVMPDGEDGPSYLVYSNFDSILRWNRSDYFALAVGHLSDALR